MLGGDFVQQILDHNGFVVFAMDFLDFCGCGAVLAYAPAP